MGEAFWQTNLILIQRPHPGFVGSSSCQSGVNRKSMGFNTGLCKPNRVKKPAGTCPAGLLLLSDQRPAFLIPASQRTSNYFERMYCAFCRIAVQGIFHQHGIEHLPVINTSFERGIHGEDHQRRTAFYRQFLRFFRYHAAVLIRRGRHKIKIPEIRRARVGVW